MPDKFDTKVLNLDAILSRPNVIDVESIRELAFIGMAVFAEWRVNPRRLIVNGIEYELKEVDE